jgi:hypothetical protein
LSLHSRAARRLRHDTRGPANELHVGRFEIDHQVLVALIRLLFLAFEATEVESEGDE